ncbi:hypothetical protein BKK48_02815 [Rodentibacter heidelbergensis]|uniref:Uncharacterized protein n=1 Tax=Rodentibacter heidelbergensis TaxID=1908258 RepID=A0A1V3IB49_9PAST|nr:hypothetical protein BKK48_02815 [Rodentibacter heidelbergensis]
MDDTVSAKILWIKLWLKLSSTSIKLCRNHLNAFLFLISVNIDNFFSLYDLYQKKSYLISTKLDQKKLIIKRKPQKIPSSYPSCELFSISVDNIVAGKMNPIG